MNSTLISQVGKAIETHLPNFSNLNPFSTDGMIFLLTTGMLGRLMVGGTRTVADAPPLNPNDDQSPQQKTNIQLERFFMEFIGVPINFAVLKLCEDLGEYAFMLIDRELLPKLGTLFKAEKPWGNTTNPSHWLAQLSEFHTEAEQLLLARALVYTFHPEYRRTALSLKQEAFHKAHHTTFDPSSTPHFEKLAEFNLPELHKLLNNNNHTLSRTFNNSAKFSTLEAGLTKLIQLTPADSIHLQRIKGSAGFKQLAKNFAHNNIKTNFFLLGAGTVGSTIFSGILWQYMNDGIFRKKVVPLVGPAVTNLYYGKEYQKEWNDQQTALFAEENQQKLGMEQALFALTQPPALPKLSSNTTVNTKTLATVLQPSYFYANSLLSFRR